MEEKFKIFVLEVFTKNGDVARQHLAKTKIELLELVRVYISAGVSFRKYVLVFGIPLREEDWEKFGDWE